MELNLPILDQLLDCQNLLIAGMGGGFDLFCGLPIYFELRKRGKQVHLANFSFADIANFREGINLTDTLVGVTADYEQIVPYFPELYLARWFKQREQAVTVWAFGKTGADPLLKNYRVLVEHLSIDGILLVDGGVDALIRGDENGTGTLIEDATSLFAVNELTDVPLRLMTCLGLGAERDMGYGHIFENIAGLTKVGGFLGSCSLTPQMEVYQDYEEAVLFVQDQPFQDPSVINSSVVSAVRGEFGNYHLTEKTKGSSLWISPLMGIYWFFDLPAVAQRNIYLAQLRGTKTFMQAVRVYSQCAQQIPKRGASRIPLS